MNSHLDDRPERGVRSPPSPDREGEARSSGGDSDEWMRPGDRRLLDSLRRDGPESTPLLSSRIGMHLKYARKRCEALEARELVRSRDGRRYELTERGERRLARNEVGETGDQ